MRRGVRDRFEQVIAEHYERLKGEVLATVRGKLAVQDLYPDPLDLDAAYNAAWHALYERRRKGGEPVDNLGGWLATIAFRRAIDDVRHARRKYLAPVAVDESIGNLGYEHDLDAEIADRQRYHQWLISVRLRLNAREQQAVSLCVLQDHSRRDASEIMGIDIKRLDKVMVAANKKLGGLLDAINRGDWCEDQRSLIKAFALGLHEEGGERRELAVRHLTECQACAAYVRSLRGLTGVVPAPAALASAVAAGGGAAGGLAGFVNGGASGAALAGGAGTAAGGGGAVLLGGLGAKGAALCVSAVCAVGGVVIAVDRAPRPDRKPTPSRASENQPVTRVASGERTPSKPTARRRSSATKSRVSTAESPPDPQSAGAQQIAELGIEPQAISSATPESASAIPTRATGSEFDFEGP